VGVIRSKTERPSFFYSRKRKRKKISQFFGIQNPETHVRGKICLVQPAWGRTCWLCESGHFGTVSHREKGGGGGMGKLGQSCFSILPLLHDFDSLAHEFRSISNL